MLPDPLQFILESFIVRLYVILFCYIFLNILLKEVDTLRHNLHEEGFISISELVPVVLVVAVLALFLCIFVIM